MRRVTQFRVENDNRFYSPHRDVANLGHVVFDRAFELLGKDNWPTWVAKLAEAGQVTEDDICAVAVSMSHLMQMVPFPDRYGDFDSCWEASGLKAISQDRPVALACFQAIVGSFFIPLCFNGYRDVTPLGDHDRAFSTHPKALFEGVTQFMLWRALPLWVRSLSRWLSPRLSRRLLNWAVDRVNRRRLDDGLVLRQLAEYRETAALFHTTMKENYVEQKAQGPGTACQGACRRTPEAGAAAGPGD